MSSLPSLSGVKNAARIIKDIIEETPFQFNERISNELNCNVYLKREDLQQVRSFKIRGAYNKINSIVVKARKNGVVCASAGNHAQGFALACSSLRIQGQVYMPTTTPKQKIEQVKTFGKNYVKVELIGDFFDDCQSIAIDFAKQNNKIFIHAFDDIKVIEGQGTTALEILNQFDKQLDYLFVPIGGGGLISGVLTVFKELSPKTKIIGVEPSGAKAMKKSLEKGKLYTLTKIDKFVDGAAVKRVGELTLKCCKKYLDEIIHVHEGKICKTILDLYNKDGIVSEPAGALGIAGLEVYSYKKIKNKNVGVFICGGNNDFFRISEIKERALLYAKLKHYFILKFPQRSGALKDFLNKVLGPNDDITFFEYSKKNSRTNAPAIIGIELKKQDDLKPLVEKMKKYNFFGEHINNKPDLFQIFLENT
ncbi:MAG: threonine dehydratase [Flavobacteriales bacterium]|nr:threonine dehydratase [Flavobacteriales bacterium]|tara:strand:- start:378 stop:1640 length:1263 start_codon:yes stop_codon:yes gene_type:complete